MNFEFFIVKRIISATPGHQSGIRSLVNISVIAISLSLAIMILSVAILFGFKKEIKDKLAGFSSHIQISNLDSNNSYESTPISGNLKLIDEIKSLKGVIHVEPFATKPGLVKSGTNIQGIVLMGMVNSPSMDHLEEYLLRGRLPQVNSSESLEVMISEGMAQMLQLDTSSRLLTYFIENPPRARPFRITGIYHTGIPEYDNLIVFCSLGQIREINQWAEEEVGGFGVFLKKPTEMDRISDRIREKIFFGLENGGTMYQVKTLAEIAPGFFDFLKLTDMNVWVILVLMVLVAGFNMISGLLILILDRTRMIGTLRALGSNLVSLRKIFLYNSAWIIGKGLIFGNVIGIALCLIQDRFNVIPLDPESYFVDSVPILINVPYILVINLLTLLLTLMMLLIPSGIISRLSPEKTIKFD